MMDNLEIADDINELMDGEPEMKNRILKKTHTHTQTLMSFIDDSAESSTKNIR